MSRVWDNHPAIAIKPVVLAKSGVYRYSHADMCARWPGFNPTVKKAVYTEYRPPEVLQRAKDKFGLVTMSVEHTDDETDEYNFDVPGQVSAVIGDDIKEERLQDGELALIGKAAFFKRDIMDYMDRGNKETSADYKSRVVPDPSGKHDFLLKEIVSVNNVVVTEAGRGGELVRVRDSIKQLNKNNGGSEMNILEWLGIGRATDSKTKLSKVIFDGVEAVAKIDRVKDQAGYLAAVETEGKKVAEIVTRLQDGAAKEGITSIVKAGFTEPEKLLATKDKSAKVLDALHELARVKDADDVKKTLDTLGEMSTEDDKLTPEQKAAKEKELADARSKDTATQIKEGLDAMRQEFSAALPGLITTAVAAVLKIGPEKHTKDTKGDMTKQVNDAVQQLLGGKPEGGEDDRVIDSLDEDDKDAGAFLEHSF
jgi:hypothetical protein